MVFKSTDAGITWNAVGLKGYQVKALAVDPATPTSIYAGTDSGVWKSIDAGTNWEWTPFRDVAEVRALAIDPSHPNTIYAGTDHGVFKSTQGAAKGSWTKTADPSNSGRYL